MGTKTVTYAVCDGTRYGKPCGKVLERPEDGLVIRGTVRKTGDTSSASKPLVGTQEGVRGGGSDETALCWQCWHDVVKDPLYEAEQSANARWTEESYRGSK